MLKKEHVEHLGATATREAILELRRKRQRIRNYFNCPVGIEFLHELIVDSKLLEVIDPEDAVEVAGRNFALSVMDKLGIFDEEKLDSILKLALTQKDLVGAFKEIEDGN